MPMPCSICINERLRGRVTEMVAQGLSDRAIASALGLGHMSVARHRRNHVVAPARQMLAIAEKGTPQRREREALARAAASEAPGITERVKAALSLEALATRLRKVERRLERAAEAAEGTPTALAAVSNSQIRALDFAARLGGTGGYAARREAAREQPVFSVVINLGDRTETITATTARVVDAEAPPEAPEEEGADDA